MNPSSNTNDQTTGRWSTSAIPPAPTPTSTTSPTPPPIPPEVIVLDADTAEPIGTTQPPKDRIVPQAEAFQAETTLPEGAPAIHRERKVWPPLMAAMAVIGMIVVGGFFAAYGGWSAAAMAMTWLALGYAVSWIVVWAAGVFRARDEKEVEAQIDQRHRQG
jgi:hypothetical protein